MKEDQQFEWMEKQLRMSRIIIFLLACILITVLLTGVMLTMKLSGIITDLKQGIDSFVDTVIPMLDKLDIEGLNDAVDNLNKAVEPIAKLFG